MDLLKRTISSIVPLNTEAMQQAQVRLDILTKPLGSLGRLESIAKQLAGITGNPRPQISKKCVVVMAGDHGVASEGVSAFPSEVTYQMVANFIRGGAGINVLARHSNADVFVVDMGVAVDIDLPGVINRKIDYGTRNMVIEPAMTYEQAVKALEAGVEIAKDLIKNQGYTLLATGEMGIANTTPSSALLAVFGGLKVEDVCGRGTGIDEAGLKNKQNAIRKAIEVNQPNVNDPIDVLAKVGGYEIAGLAGLILGAAANKTPIIIDGFISSAAALIAQRIAPLSVEYMIPSHASEEPGHKMILELLGLKPMLLLNMRLGEGTGAALAMHIVEGACKIINEMATFADAGVTGP
ncbi:MULTISPECIES: nicotinate-nucleotide--dimethylbenzimidazole phosphoribosyltransferase [Carboxydocella]|uniref:Nicotinate-nucleotide--dimethylbenzimidazole phosphoribosyltransferase n=2 Tax=Carboxydocella TaxID=178898 RepID=A0A1T4LRB8_9FIRM|nr:MULTISPECIES: nicotinate-nucleotide--dimethylbenzimidazole phosphoribosyltransferase [Carboxydocella]AVX20577.1 nicotinate-nucleotide-dimethylbenzimidazole phosphoribosyltransferase [Carboxydocella thermautotrophica]AVX30999.1 nicotinate-nucleotide-dimethylbenzimidazole phosphoribosyltransferase [Carboxydocella thermautotrophica]SJZ57282.1 nicotinate-nucleotide-dimethylbenzimidazole phosphoribosyltransferase [Carboxydocella sporoproducens DSM 16521]GAW27899.1 nicotinate-nucleotide--dimethylb